MTIRSINWAVGVSLVAAVLAVGTIVPASAQVTAVPREGVAFNDSVTARRSIPMMGRWPSPCPTGRSWSCR